MSQRRPPSAKRPRDRRGAASPPAGARGREIEGMLYAPRFVSTAERRAIVDWLATLHPIWEERYSAHNPPPAGAEQRRLLRPVYWLGAWQFACLDYYRPPHGVANRAVRAEPFPPVLAALVREIEQAARATFAPADVPPGWHLNTCLINFYGARVADGGKRVDVARVGEHKDFEPGPVGSLSFGERALFQFVTSRARGSRDAVVLEQWLDDGSLQLFGGEQFKRRVFHRVQRVDRKGGHTFDVGVPDFVTRRVNFTFRYVPDEHIVRYAALSDEAREDVRGYMRELAAHSSFFAEEIAAERTAGL